MADKIDGVNTVSTSLSPLEGEGLRGDGTAKWYVVHTYSGYENKVKTKIESMVEYRGMQDLILDVQIPTEERVEIKDGRRKTKTVKLFPGYVIIKMIVNNETWYLVRNTEGVTGSDSALQGGGRSNGNREDENRTGCRGRRYDPHHRRTFRGSSRYRRRYQSGEADR